MSLDYIGSSFELNHSNIFSNKLFNKYRKIVYERIISNLKPGANNISAQKLRERLRLKEFTEISNIESLLKEKFTKSLILKDYIQEISSELKIASEFNFEMTKLLEDTLILDLVYYGPLTPFFFSHLKIKSDLISENSIIDYCLKYTFSTTLIELQINNHKSIYFESTEKIVKLDYKFISNSHLERTIINLINEANHLKKQNYVINYSSPILDFELAFNQLRASAILPPASSSPCLTIRFHPQESFTLEKLEQASMFNTKILEFLKALQSSGISIAIAGTMSTGKTTLLSSLIKEWNPNARKALIEDTREIESSIDNLIQLQINKKDNQSNIKDLVKACKRHSIKYVALSESRDGDAWEIVQLAQNIYGCLMTYHNTVREKNKKVSEALNNLAYLCSLNSESPNIEEIKSQIASNIKILILLKQESKSRRRIVDSIHYINKAIFNKVTEFSSTEIFRHENENFKLINRIPELENYFHEKGVNYQF